MKRTESDVDLFSITSNLNTLSSVSQLLSARKGNKHSYFNEITPEQVEKINRTIDRIDPEYFKEDFNIGYLLDQVDKDSTIDGIDQLSVKIYGFYEAIDSKFNGLIMKSYNSFVEGMSQVYEIEKDLAHSAVMCKSGKHYLNEVQKDLTAFGFILLQKYRKKQIYQYLHQEIEKIRDINNATKKVDRLLEIHDFPNAILYSQTSNKTILSSAHYTCISNITSSFQSNQMGIIDKIDSTFTEICHNFNENTFEKIMRGYLYLQQKQHLKDRVHQNFILNIEDHTRKILRSHLYNNYTRPEELNSMKFVDICGVLKEDHYVISLLAILEHLSDLMCAHYRMRITILKMIKNAEENEEKEFYIEILKLLSNNKKQMWNSIQNQVKHLLSACKTTFKIEEFIKVLQSINQFIEVGHEFSSSTEESNILRTAMKEKSLGYFENFHKNTIENLKVMLENEMWQKILLPNNYTVLDIQEFGAVISASTVPGGANSSATSTATSTPMLLLSPYLALNAAADKHISLELDDHRSEFFEQFIKDGNPFLIKEGRKTLSEAAGDRISSSSNGGNALNGHGESSSDSSSGSTTTSSPNISAITVNVIRLIGKYLQMMKILRQLSYLIFTAISHLLEYYVYTVFVFFGECNNPNLFEQDTFANVSPVLKKTMQRLKLKFVGQTPPQTSMLNTTHLFQSKLSSSPISLRGSSDHSKSPPTLSSLGATGSSGNNASGNSITDDSISIQWSMPKLSPEIDLAQPRSLECRVVGLESMMFLVEAIMEAQPLVLSLVPAEKAESIHLFYSETVSVISALRNLCYKNIAIKSLKMDPNNLINIVANDTRWELKDAPPNPSPYVNMIFKLLHFFNGMLDEVEKKSGVLTQKVKNVLWENAVIYVMETLIDSYSKIKKCNNHGRTLMTMDLKELQSSLEIVSAIKPIPHLQHVDKYIKAYFLPDSDIFNLARDSEFSVRQVIGVVNVANHLKKQQKQKLISDLEELEKQRKSDAFR
ncbi:hypothetical protein SAMD00019534_041150 [Acytostelium subglobosum LB1]|uniref:hypothetical protein n=1 Tax=Acytostelium subglobosum LB1 TaxID=1410327 RepID=UPI000644F645|nr:hypothetical protein SAMD00019534_041150 [Acytostelium subglobosum LB1]GAM20940.1 hypothetical protein SAMD00019534_041150 [Acytostelium subglobosum LB1]|eukprot:XP_012756074.1 hypothetical protein SAMD00019534_041150 [Acytostelium subglobosum LB1]